MSDALQASAISAAVDTAMRAQPIIDMHTHLYPPTFGTPDANRSGKTDANGMLLWGSDELLTYHYLVAEVYRVVPASKLPYADFWKMTKQQQADHIWKYLFQERSPMSEACRGVLTTIQKLGLDPTDTPANWRNHFAQQDPSDHIDNVMQIANVKSITMTNAVFDDNERSRWLADEKVGRDPRFTAVLRIDLILRDYPNGAKKMSEWGYNVQPETGQSSIDEARRFLRDWLDRTRGIYVAVSLPPEFRHPADPADAVARAGQTMLEQVVLPVCAERGLPFAMMIGSRLKVNPDLRDGGDAEAKSDIVSLQNLCRQFPKNKFFVTMLARENQHELAVTARKFGNLMVFGCWWFLNNPSLIDEITRMRMELLGTSFIPQHSDARVLDQLIYKWEHSRQLIGRVLTDKYVDVSQAGWPVMQKAIERDVKLLVHDNFLDFLKA